MNEYLITEKDYHGEDEKYSEYYKCHCGQCIEVGDNYCSQCGHKLKFDLSRKLKHEWFLNRPQKENIKNYCNRCKFYKKSELNYFEGEYQKYCFYGYGEKHHENDTKPCPFFTTIPCKTCVAKKNKQCLLSWELNTDYNHCEQPKNKHELYIILRTRKHLNSKIVMKEIIKKSLYTKCPYCQKIVKADYKDDSFLVNCSNCSWVRFSLDFWQRKTSYLKTSQLDWVVFQRKLQEKEKNHA